MAPTDIVAWFLEMPLFSKFMFGAAVGVGLLGLSGWYHYRREDERRRKPRP